jgi:uncharacterized protein (TIGR02596 family)
MVGITARRGFTLIELIVVISIVLVLSVVAVPAIHSISSGKAITRSAQIITDQLALARQEAMGKNRDIQVRFIHLTTAPAGYRAIQLWALSRNDITRYEPIARAISLPNDAIIAHNEIISPLLGNAPVNDDALFPVFSNSELQYFALRFRPNGGTDLPFATTNNYLTLVNTRYANTAALPKNYAIVQINPENGHVSVYRP